MKSRSLFLTLLAALSVMILLTFSTCKRPPCPCCQAPVPVFTSTLDGITIKTDSVGPNQNVRLEVTSFPGNTPLFLDTIPAGAEQTIPVPDSIEQVRIRMDYLPADPNSPTKVKCVCPVEVIINTPCKNLIVMDVIIQREGCVPLCTNPLTSALSAANSKLIIIQPVPTSNTVLCRFRIRGNLFNIEYQNVSGAENSNKFILKNCGPDFSSTKDVNDKIILTANNATIEFDVSYSVAIGSGITIQIERMSGSDQIEYCAP